MRYAAEAATLALEDAEPMAVAAAAVQEVLGEQHDAVVAGRWLRDIAATNVTRAEAMVAGLLIAAEQREARGVGRQVARRLGRTVEAQGPEVAGLTDDIDDGHTSGRPAASCGASPTIVPSRSCWCIGPADYDDWTFPKGKREPDRRE